MYGGRKAGFSRWRVAGESERAKITQHCAVFRVGNNAKRWEPTNTAREPGLKGTGSGRFVPPVPGPYFLR